jgi:hypothetical protein
MGTIKSIESLNPNFQPIVQRIIAIAKSDFNTNLVVNETLRQDPVQVAYYYQGREPLKLTNEYRQRAGLPPIDETENKSKITNVPHVSTEKGHGAGLAIDFVPEGNWESKTDKWNVIGAAVQLVNEEFAVRLKNIGFEVVWGGNWNEKKVGFKDSPHVEMVRLKKPVPVTADPKKK